MEQSKKKHGNPKNAGSSDSQKEGKDKSGSMGNFNRGKNTQPTNQDNANVNEDENPQRKAS